MSSLALQYDSDDDPFKANLLHMTPDLLDLHYEEAVHESEENGQLSNDDPNFLDMDSDSELLDPYYEAVNESEGFDAPLLYEVDLIGQIVPMFSYNTPEVRELAEKAIEHYNNQHGTIYEVVNIVKANQQAARGILYYITFDVKEVGAAPELPTTTFQARVLDGIGVIEVELCRPKPPPKN